MERIMDFISKKSEIFTIGNWEISMTMLKICYDWCDIMLYENRNCSEEDYIISPEEITLKTNGNRILVKDIIIILTYPNKENSSFLELSYFRHVENCSVSDEGQIVGESIKNKKELDIEVKEFCKKKKFYDGFLFLKRDLIKCEQKLADIFQLTKTNLQS